MRPRLMLRDMSTWRRRKSTFSPAGTIGMPMWLGANAPPSSTPNTASCTPANAAALACRQQEEQGRQAAADPDDEEAGLRSPVLDRSAPQHRLDALGVQVQVDQQAPAGVDERGDAGQGAGHDGAVPEIPGGELHGDGPQRRYRGASSA